MKSFKIRNLFTRLDNILSLLIIFSAIIAAITSFSSSRMSTDNLLAAMLLLLASLATSNIVEREARFEKSEGLLSETLKKLNHIKDPKFFKIAQLAPIEEYMEGFGLGERRLVPRA